ncbi:MAG: HD-GYP domain-containing protein [Solirubrobacterales bacterium]
MHAGWDQRRPVRRLSIGLGANGAIRTSRRDIAIRACERILAETSASTAEHSSDVVLITQAIGERMGIAGAETDELLASARLHDIGKAWIPRRILEKPGPLSDDEWKLMREHTVVGEEILSTVAELKEVGRIVRHSHERWDGGGYPDGLKGDEVPLGSRIVFCADTFHAIRCDRPYRAGRSAAEAVTEIKRCAGTQFDPEVAAALEVVVRDTRRRSGVARSPRLIALLMCLVVGGAGTALAHSDLLGSAPAAASVRTPPPGCGTAACPTVAGPVGGLSAVGEPGAILFPRALFPALPGQLHGGATGGNRGTGGTKEDQGKSDSSQQGGSGKSSGADVASSGGSHSSGKSGFAGAHTPSHPSSGRSRGGGSGRSGASRPSSGGDPSSRGKSGSSPGNSAASTGGGASHGNSGSSTSSGTSGSAGTSGSSGTSGPGNLGNAENAGNAGGATGSHRP